MHYIDSTRLVFLEHVCVFFFFNDTATTEIYTLSLHDALPISQREGPARESSLERRDGPRAAQHAERRDRKSTRLNSSHSQISYAVFCLKKKKQLPMCPFQTTSSASHHSHRRVSS